jgi:hypothetical protein
LRWIDESLQSERSLSASQVTMENRGPIAGLKFYIVSVWDKRDSLPGDR